MPLQRVESCVAVACFHVLLQMRHAYMCVHVHVCMRLLMYVHGPCASMYVRGDAFLKAAPPPPRTAVEFSKILVAGFVWWGELTYGDEPGSSPKSVR